VPHFLDTNILLYSISSDPAEVAKRDRAVTLLDQDDGEPHSRKIERVRIVNPFR
jgi:predicted nucleic acid-binding protein